MAKVIVIIECDYNGYEPFTAGRCRYDHRESLTNIRLSVDMVSAECRGKAAYLIHTSPFIRRNFNDVFYTSSDYLSLWKHAVSTGGELGIHLHEEEPDGSCFYYGYSMHLERIVAEHVRLLTEVGLQPTCESTGYYGMNEWLVPIMETNNLLVNLDNIGEFSKFTSRNWALAPAKPYFVDRTDVFKEGSSRILAVPLGMTCCCRGEDGLMTGPNSLGYLKSLWRAIRSESSPESTLFLLIEAQRMRRDLNKVRQLLRFLKSEGAEFSVPTEVYNRYATERGT